MNFNKKEYILLLIVFIILITIKVYSNTPAVSNLVINTTLKTNLTNENLTAYWIINEPGFKNVTIWNVNGVSFPILYLPFENNSNASLTEDYTTFHNNGNVSGAIYNLSAGYDGYGAYNFTTGSYISVPTLDALVRNNYSYGGWVKFDTFSCPGIVPYCVVMSQLDANNNGFALFTSSITQGGILCSAINGVTIKSTNGVTIQTNKWYHFMCTSNSTALCFYLNGEQQDCIDSDIMGVSNNFYIGGQVLGNTFWFNGSIDEVYVFNKSLSSEQIKFLYENKTNIISSEETSKGQVWNFTVIPVNSSQKGIAVNSSSLLIKNSVPIIKNISLEENLTSIGKGYNYTFNCSSYIQDDDNDYLNISYFWYEGNNIIISNNTAGSNMSNFTDTISGTIYANTNLTGNNYRLGYNYSCGVYVCDGTACNQSNSSMLFINDSFPYFNNITYFNNILKVSINKGYQFNGSVNIADKEVNQLLNISFTWYEGNNIIISNNTNGGNMSNITNARNETTYYTSQNLTINNYKLGYNYSLGVYVCDGYYCNQSNSSTLQIQLYTIDKISYLGTGDFYSLGFDDYLYGTDGLENSRRQYDGMKFFLSTYYNSSLKIVLTTIPKPETAQVNRANITNPIDNYRWNIADYEFDKVINLCGHGYNHSFEFVPGITDSKSANDTILNSYNMLTNVIGRNMTCWKFAGYSEVHPYGSIALSNLPYIMAMRGEANSNYVERNLSYTNIIEMKDLMGIAILDFSTGSRARSGHFCPSDQGGDCMHPGGFSTELTQAKGRNISILDWDELGELYDMYNGTNLTINNFTTFNINSDATFWSYRKRLAINITGIIDDATHSYLQVTTPSGIKVAQNRIKYTGTGKERAALIIIPVENGTYTITNLSIQPTDPSFVINNITIYANNTKWGFNSSDANGSAYMMFKLQWTGNVNIWGDYNNTNSDFNITHGFRFNQSQGDKWWVEHSMETGKLSILGPSGPGTEYITAQLPFTFVKSIDNSNYKRYIINNTNVFFNMTGNFNFSIPEIYASNWKMNVTYPNGTTLTNIKFYQGGSTIFSLPIIMEDSSTIIDYYGETNLPSIDLTPNSDTNLYFGDSIPISCVVSDNDTMDNVELTLDGTTVCYESANGQTSVACNYNYKTDSLGDKILTCTGTDLIKDKDSKSVILTIRANSGSSGGSSGGSSTTKNPIIDVTQQEQTTTLTKGQSNIIIYDQLDHTIVIDSVNSDSVTFTIDNRISSTIFIKESKEIDLTGDGINDIRLTLNSIILNKADISVEKLANASPEQKTEITTKKVSLFWWLLVLLSLVIIGNIIYFIFFKKKY
ncbi:MAG: LamG domain-containing protein [Candidatus Nanoarchaeia archaeon]|nr:LamG domain-containing protein [Candidatus Nanoarchaeia archaeon]